MFAMLDLNITLFDPKNVDIGATWPCLETNWYCFQLVVKVRAHALSGTLP